MIRAIAAVMIAVVAAFCGLPVCAATEAPDSHIAAALELLEATNAKATMFTMIDALEPLILAQIRTRSPNLSDADLQQFESAFREEMMNSVDDVMTLTARVYAEHFTEDDLRKLVAFYGSEIGKKYILNVPLIIKETVPIGAAWGREAGARAAQRATERLRANGVNL
jgi:hypothetical protein